MHTLQKAIPRKLQHPAVAGGHLVFISGESPVVQAPKTGHHRLGRELAGRGFRVEEARGVYGGAPERSWVVHLQHDSHLDDLCQLAGEYGQESILHTKDGRHQIIFTSGPNAGKATVPSSGVKIVSDHTGARTSLRVTPQRVTIFSYNLDFDSPLVAHGGSMSDKMSPQEVLQGVRKAAIDEFRDVLVGLRKAEAGALARSSPPGWGEKAMHALKGKVGTERAFKIAWAAHNKGYEAPNAKSETGDEMGKEEMTPKAQLKTARKSIFKKKCGDLGKVEWCVDLAHEADPKKRIKVTHPNPKAVVPAGSETGWHEGETKPKVVEAEGSGGQVKKAAASMSTPAAPKAPGMGSPKLAGTAPSKPPVAAPKAPGMAKALSSYSGAYQRANEEWGVKPEPAAKLIARPPSDFNAEAFKPAGVISSGLELAQPAAKMAAPPKGVGVTPQPAKPIAYMSTPGGLPMAPISKVTHFGEPKPQPQRKGSPAFWGRAVAGIMGKDEKPASDPNGGACKIEGSAITGWNYCSAHKRYVFGEDGKCQGAQKPKEESKEESKEEVKKGVIEDIESGAHKEAKRAVKQTHFMHASPAGKLDILRTLAHPHQDPAKNKQPAGQSGELAKR